MPETAVKRCLIAVDTAAEPRLLLLTLPLDATIEVALSAAREQFAQLWGEASVDWERLPGMGW
jgi:hypothetical protein